MLWDSFLYCINDSIQGNSETGNKVFVLSSEVSFNILCYTNFRIILCGDYYLSGYFRWSDPSRQPASVRINWHWTATRYVLRRGSEDIGCSCQWHILCVWQGPVNSVLSKKATTELEALSRQKSISISSDVQKKVMILMHL